MKTCELQGAELDYWVGRALGDRLVRIVRVLGDPVREDRCESRFGEQWDWSYFAPSRAWMDGGPIIERERIGVTYGAMAGVWYALRLADGILTAQPSIKGPTPLIAAMRAFVASKFGDTVPDEQEPA
jgi:hypothetical protein